MSIPPVGTVAVTRRRAVLGVTAGVLVLAVLGAGVVAGFGPQLRLDDAASRWMYIGDDAPTWLHDLLSVVTAPGLTVVRLVVFLPVAIWLGVRRAWWTLGWVVVALGGIGVLTSLLKALFDRVRPQFAGGGAQLSTLSFPSGHSSGIATLATVALVLAWPLLDRAARRRWLAAGIVITVVVGLSRMWLGVHYLTDVLGGWSLGVAWSLALALAFGALPGGRAALRSHVPAERVA